MGNSEVQTEQLIQDTAKKLFFEKGLMKATTAEIAKEAGVNRALIHYYFRSREHMMEILLEDAMTDKRDRVRSILATDMPFREKISKYIETIIGFGLQYPYLENFIINETNRNPDIFKQYCTNIKVKSTEMIREQLEEEIKNNKLAPITPEHFLVNVIALCNYPLHAKPILQTIHGMSDDAYKTFLIERKRVIYETIFNETHPISFK
jgi:TetR/AcrR family transcriptional regulator